ncbi:MAG: lactonase family protein [Isosphaeraceae bacterium]|nr:lactonase family protein [Isosphaeraceae bacterium]
MPFNTWVKAVLVGSLLFAAGALPSWAESRQDEGSWVFFGTYTGGRSAGIYRGTFDPTTGKVSGVKLAAKAASPSFLAIHPTHRFLYAVDEVADFDGKKAGAVTAFALDPKTGELTRLNQQSTIRTGPCHLVDDPGGRNVLVANYGGGSVCVLPIQPDGRLKSASSFVQHEGSGANPQRQEAPHAHSINLDPAGRFAAVADLGLDQVRVYRFAAAPGTLTPNDPPFVKLPPGAGPRHFAFHPRAPFAYAINELNSTVTAFGYDGEKGILSPFQTVTTVPEGYRGENYPADVQIHPSGRFLYGSNRGHNSIAAYTIDPQSGRLTARGQQGEGIKVPRGFGIDPTGTWLLVGNQDADSAIAFRIDAETGALKPNGEPVDVPKPVCVKFVPVGR